MGTKANSRTILGTKTLTKRLVQLVFVAGLSGCVSVSVASLDDFLDVAIDICSKFPNAIVAYGFEHDGETDWAMGPPPEAPPSERQAIAPEGPRFWLSCGGRVRDVEND